MTARAIRQMRGEGGKSDAPHGHRLAQGGLRGLGAQRAIAGQPRQNRITCGKGRFGGAIRAAGFG